MSDIKYREVKDMYDRTSKLPGLDFFINQNFDLLSTEDQAKYALLAENYMTELTRLASRITSNQQEIMCHEIIFDKTQVFDPYDNRFLKEYPLEVTNYTYAPIKKCWLGIKVRELNKWIEILIPDPHGTITRDMAVEMAVEEAQNYIDESIRVYNEWEIIRGKFG